MRHPATSVSPRPFIDLDSLTLDFAKMNVRDGPRKRLVRVDSRQLTASKRTHTCPSHHDRPAATLFIRTRPPPAPLPALIRPIIPVPTPHSPITRHPPTRPSSASPMPDMTSAYTLRFSTLASEEPLRQRKMSPLPRRTPVSTSPPYCRGASSRPKRVPGSPLSGPSSISRESSFQSLSSSQTRRWSDSSSASSVIVTPESSTTPLPDHLSSPAIADDWGSPYGFLSDPTSGRLSPVHGIRLDLPTLDGQHAAANKQPFNFTFNSPFAMGRNAL